MRKNDKLEKAENISDLVDELISDSDDLKLTRPARKKLETYLAGIRSKLEAFNRKIDDTELPDAFFDPSDPILIGRFIALALVAQERKSLQSISSFYGSGVYAIYYVGTESLYQPISNTETPIYVGKADPKGNPKTVVEQGTKLFGRLKEHKNNIDRVSGIDIDDFEYRALAVQSGFQASAESHLIKSFKPIWNSETKILYGLGKHGDSSTTRANTRSPFDTIHPGRKWAADNPIGKSIKDTKSEVRAFFQSTTIYKDIDDVLAAFIEELKPS